MDSYQNKLRKPRIIIYNVREETTTDNIEATILAQTPEIKTNDEIIEAKFRFKKKKRQDDTTLCGSRTTDTYADSSS